MCSFSLEIKDRLETGQWLGKISLSSDGFLKSGVTKECLKSRGKLSVDKKRLIILYFVLS